MQTVVSARVGTTASGRSRYSGCNCCSTDAKKLFRSMWRKPKRSDASPQRASSSPDSSPPRANSLGTPSWSGSGMALVRLDGTPLYPGISQEINHLALDLVHFFRPKALPGAPPLGTTLVCPAALFNYNCGVKDRAVD